MRFGPTPPKKVPAQDSSKVLRIAERWQRATWAHTNWAETAKKCVDMFEGRQYTAAQIAEAARQGRPLFKFNVIKPLVNLILGYQRQNKTDITFSPGQDSLSVETTAEALSRLEKSIAQGCELDFIDCEVFLDGLLTGRGWFDTRLDWTDNDLGTIKTKARDPFLTKPDPDADTYDINESGSYITTERYVSVDEIECSFGPKVSQLIKPFVSGNTPLAPLSSFVINDDVVPVRTFGETEGLGSAWWDQFYSLSGDFVDTYRKTIRLIECQYKVYEPKNVIIDLETGDTKVLPDEWDEARIQKALLYCEAMNNPCYVQQRNVERVHWTTVAGDLILYDAPSMYDGFTINGYFPYFRRGKTKGMVDDMIDPQLEKNKRRNSEIETAARTANGGWLYHEKALDPKEERNLKRFGARPGVTIKYKGEQKPEVIAPAGPNMKHDRLETKADDDLRTISGVNESALGELDRVQSGRAIEARQRQAVMAVQMYFDNFKRSKVHLGHRHLDIIQNHYTEPRMYRIMGEDSKFVTDWINQKIVNPQGGPDRILNDVTVGKYVAIVDPTPISATFMQAQFEETMTLLEKLGPAGAQLMPAVIDLVIASSSLPRKQEWIERLQKVLGVAPGGTPAGAPPGAPQGGPPALPPPGGPGGGQPQQLPSNVVPLPVRQ